VTKLSQNWLVATFVGLAATVAYWLYWLAPTATVLLERLLVPIYLVVVFVALAYWLLFGPAGLQLRRAARRTRLAWAAVASVGAVVLVVGLPIRPPVVPRAQQLELVATGEKNNASQGSEVWVDGLDLANGTTVAATDFILDAGWQVRNGLAMSQDRQPATLRWQGPTSGDARLRLLTHGWSGVVQVRWNGGQARTLDLYSATAGEAVVPLPYQGESGSYTALQMAALLATTVSLAALIYILGGVALVVARRRPRFARQHPPGGESTR
jgi:hypothetical protein